MLPTRSKRHEKLLDYVERMLLAYKYRRYAEFSKHLQAFYFFSSQSKIQLPFLKNKTQSRIFFKTNRSVEIKYSNPSPYIILKQFQYHSTMKKCLMFVGPNTRNYINCCLERGKLLTIENWVDNFET